MSAATHTPAPWIIRDGSFIDGPGFRDLATVRGAHVQYELEAQANARLIAAAPELLQLLIEAMESRAPDQADAAHPGWGDRARAAIAKATGAA